MGAAREQEIGYCEYIARGICISVATNYFAFFFFIINGILTFLHVPCVVYRVYYLVLNWSPSGITHNACNSVREQLTEHGKEAHRAKSVLLYEIAPKMSFYPFEDVLFKAVVGT